MTSHYQKLVADVLLFCFLDFVFYFLGGFHFICISQVKVLYGGTELFDDEVRQTFHNDMKLAVISGACITVLVYVLTSFSGKV